MNVPRSEVVSYSFPLFRGENAVFIKYPSDNYNFDAYLLPFTFWSWIFTLLFLLVVPLFLYGFVNFGKEKKYSTVYDVFGWTAMALVKLNISLNFSSLPNRIAIFR